MARSDAGSVPLGAREVLRAFWPLAVSWAFMSAELPVLAAVATRLPGGEVHLAAFGGAVFPLALSIEAPVIMLLSASTALSRDLPSYRALGRFATRLGLGLSALHAVLAATPAYDWIVVPLLDVPPPAVEPARWGLTVMIPWTWAIAYRRFQQGALIRTGHAKAVGIGTAVRFGTVLSVIGLAVLAGRVPAIVVITAAVSCGVVAEAAYSGVAAHRRARPQLDPAAERPPLRGAAFARFYVPLALTPMLSMLVLPIGAASMARMPDPLVSLALWPVLHGVVFHLQSYALAFHEVAVAHLERPDSFRVLARFAWGLSAVLGGVLVALAATPLAEAYFVGFVGLAPDQARLAARVLWLALPMPLLRARLSLVHGVLVAAHRTRPITESVAIFLAVTACLMTAFAATDPLPGIAAAYVALSAARIVETAWVEWRSRDARRRLGIGA